MSRALEREYVSYGSPFGMGRYSNSDIDPPPISRSEYADSIRRTHAERANFETERIRGSPASKRRVIWPNDLFYFRERRGYFDWRALAHVDTERIAREVKLVVNLLSVDFTRLISIVFKI